MSISLRGSRFHYRFSLAGIDHSGPCPDCDVPPNSTPRMIEAIRQKALKVEAAIRTKVAQEKEAIEKTKAEIRQNKTVQALVENYKYELTGGSPISLSEAFPLAAAKPAKRESKSSYSALRKTYWNDFTGYMSNFFPDTVTLSAVRRSHCEAYVKYLTEHGRFQKEIRYSIPGKRQRVKGIAYTRDYGISSKTIKEIVGVCKWVFSRLDEDAGLVRNPWDNVILPKQKPIDREVFSPRELRLIWDALQSNPFCYPLFVVAANSGMTEGDICTLKWCEIDWASDYIRRDRRKTGTEITLPLLPELAAFLRSLPQKGEYVFPEHAELYIGQPSCVSARVKAFLNGLGIVTTVQVEGRRAVSIKDLHSMRHVFCYRAKRAGIPESVIKKFVGHAVLAMTEHYADHDTDEELRAEIKKLPALFVGESGGLEAGNASRQRLSELAYTLPIAMKQRLL